MTNPFYAKFLPRDPFNRKLFQVLCDHIRTTLDPEITDIRFIGLIPAIYANDSYEAVAAYQREVVVAFKNNPACGDENRVWGPLQVGDFRWTWHFERRKRTDTDKMANKNEIGVPVLVFTN